MPDRGEQETARAAAQALAQLSLDRAPAPLAAAVTAALAWVAALERDARGAGPDGGPPAPRPG
jgi:hypothetical protein